MANAQTVTEQGEAQNMLTDALKACTVAEKLILTSRQTKISLLEELELNRKLPIRGSSTMTL